MFHFRKGLKYQCLTIKMMDPIRELTIPGKIKDIGQKQRE